MDEREGIYPFFTNYYKDWVGDESSGMTEDESNQLLSEKLKELSIALDNPSPSSVNETPKDPKQ